MSSKTLVHQLHDWGYHGVSLRATIHDKHTASVIQFKTGSWWECTCGSAQAEHVRDLWIHHAFMVIMVGVVDSSDAGATLLLCFSPIYYASRHLHWHDSHGCGCCYCCILACVCPAFLWDRKLICNVRRRVGGLCGCEGKRRAPVHEYLVVEESWTFWKVGDVCIFICVCVSMWECFRFKILKS